MKLGVLKGCWVATLMAIPMVLLALSIGCVGLAGCTQAGSSTQKIPVKLLILPHFEDGKMYGGSQK